MIRRVGGAAPYERTYGYCRVVLAGGWALVAGTTAVGPAGVLHPGDPFAQARAAFGIALDALASAGVPAERVVRSRMYVVDPDHADQVGRAHGEVFGAIRPVSTLVVVAGLLDPEMLVEVELEAYAGPDQGSLMRAVVQRVTSASVTVEGRVVGAIDEPGLLVLLGITHEDTAQDVARLAEKIWTLRILTGESSCAQTGAPLLVVSQFTLYADTRKGRRPSWSAAAPRPVSEPLVEKFVGELRDLGARVETGEFGAMMQVALVNDGPVTLILDTRD